MVKSKRVLKPFQEEKKEPPLQNLGWANSWEETPDIVTNCRNLKHKVSDVDVGPPNRGMEHVVKCQECRYVYRYDSSD